MHCNQQRHLFGIIGLFILLTVAPVQAADERFGQATEAYNAGEYQLAIDTFESLAENGLSAPLLYNLGNSYARADRTGMAILNYERAARLASGDSDIQGNLELLRREKGLFKEEQTVGQRFVGLLELDQWTVLAFVGFVLVAVLFVLPPIVRLKTSTRRILVAAFLLLGLSATIGARGQYGHYHDAVVVVADARLRLSPFQSAASTGIIQEGRLLTPLKTHNDYVLVMDETGRSGWLAGDELRPISL